MNARRLSFPLLLLYPLVAHAAVLVERAEIAVVWLALILLSQPGGMRHNRRVFFTTLAVVGAVMLTLLFGGGALAVLYWPPILINTGLLLLFSHSLSAGRTPVITRYAALIRGGLPPGVAEYTRKVTWAWSMAFALLTLESIALALYAPVELWSLFTNVLNYLFIALFFVLEYSARRYFLPDVEHAGFLVFCRKLVTTNLQRLNR